MRMFFSKYVVDNNTMYFEDIFDKIKDGYYEIWKHFYASFFDTNTNIYSRFDVLFCLIKHFTVLTFGYCFNRSIVLTLNKTVLMLGDYHDNSIILTPNITVLKLGWSFNRRIELTENITHVTFGNNYNRFTIFTHHTCNIWLSF